MAVAARTAPQFRRYGVESLYSVAHLFPATKRCGIYVLIFKNGDRYVGQSIDVVKRFSDHRRRWDDIESLDFCLSRRQELDDLERDMINGQQRLGHSLRNITHALGRLGGTDLDPLVTPDEQYAWLNEDKTLPDVEQRIVDQEQRLKFRPKYRRLFADAVFP